jgi:succinate dehydrogenase / fumarate reductase iron-sulfur subunit
MAEPTPSPRPRPGSRRFRVFRFRRGDPGPHYDDFDVPSGESTTVLAGLRWIKRHADPTLTVRHSCFHASCGTCGVRVNGREGLACVTRAPDDRTIQVEPMANLPVLADLVVDMEPFEGRFPDPHPILRASEFLDDAAAPSGHEGYERFEDCIECGLCVSACPVAATDNGYVGPAALAYAQRMLEDGVGDRDALLAWADGPGGVWRCHAAFECTEACPSNVRPAQRIMALRGELARPSRGSG